MIYLRRFNESRIYGYEILPKDALDELEMYVDYKNKQNKVQVFPDPKVDGTYAVRVYRDDDKFEFDLLWNHGGYDEVEFEEFPPKSTGLKFF